MAGNILSTYCSIFLGPTLPIIPLPAEFVDAIRQIEVIQSDESSGFRIEFSVGRTNLLTTLEYPLLATGLIEPYNRVAIVVTLNLMPQMLIDGVITHVQLNSRNDPGASTLTVMGKDLTVLMNQYEKVIQYPGLDEEGIALLLLATYAPLNIVPIVIPPPMVDVPDPLEKVPTQNGSDLFYLRKMAKRFGYMFYVTPGPVPYTNIAYWGPQQRVGVPAEALTIGPGPDSNILQIDFQYDTLQPVVVTGFILDKDTNLPSPPVLTVSGLEPPLSLLGMATPFARLVQQNLAGGYNYLEALALAQGQTDESRQNVVKATGELDVMRYGNVLQAPSLVGIRGAGFSYDGNYYVKEAVHKISPGTYTQNFTLTREGTGTLTPAVIP